jgi:putative ABC transport system permease protein
MKIPINYTIKSFKTKKLTTIITLVGIALVVFVFAAVLMMAHGVDRTLVATGSKDNIKIVRKGANGEISSIIGGETQDIVRALPDIAKGPNGNPLISDEPVVIINLEKLSGGLSNVTVRGVSPNWQYLRPEVKMVSGKMFNPALRELIVGNAIAQRFKDSQVGSYVKIAGNEWKIVGEFTTDGSGFDSEIWGDAHQLQDAFNRGNSVSSITLKLNNPNDFADFKKAFNSDLRLHEFDAKNEQEYYSEQSETLSMIIRLLGIFVTIIFSIGAAIGAMITMYSSVANRTVEIGTMRALGFGRTSIMTVFLIESLLIAIVGGVIGIGIASLLQFFSISTMNFDSFSEIAFSFALSPFIIILSLVFAALMGIFGGFLPAVRAARLKIVDALRSA